MAVCYGKLKMYPEAEAALKKCIAIKPGDFYAMNNVAVMMIQTGHLDEARGFAERAVKTEPGYANGHVTLGTIHAMSREYDAAEGEFREALRLDPDNQTAKENLERLKAAKGAQ
jgi:tetratricopeptide (TPR) repeat protein